jgi:hypothetical protein
LFVIRGFGLVHFLSNLLDFVRTWMMADHMFSHRVGEVSPFSLIIAETSLHRGDRWKKSNALLREGSDPYVAKKVLAILELGREIASRTSYVLQYEVLQYFVCIASLGYEYSSS